MNCISKDEEECNSDNDSENVPITSNINDITTYKKALCEIKRLKIQGDQISSIHIYL